VPCWPGRRPATDSSDDVATVTVTDCPAARVPMLAETVTWPIRPTGLLTLHDTGSCAVMVNEDPGSGMGTIVVGEAPSVP
jgi:hypothetical protein